MRKYVAEAVGTFGLVFAGTGSVVTNSLAHGAVTLVGIAFAFGLVVMAMIYAIGNVSGAQLNPAVTIGFFIARRFPLRCVLPYVASQIIGALLASAVLRLLFGNLGSLGATLPSGTAGQSFVLEIVLTAILMFVILCVATGPKEVGTMAGIAIGGVVAMEILLAGPVSGASMNPARSIGPALVSGNLTALWVYVSAPVIGAAIAVPLWGAIRAGGEAVADPAPASAQ